MSEPTFRQTERGFTFARLEPVQVKGKAEPLSIWQPLAARARFGADVIQASVTPLVGRELERALLIATFERAAKQRACQLVTLVGEPGVGKTRLCSELFQYIEQRPGLVRWRQGLPVSLWHERGVIAFWARSARSSRPRAASSSRTSPRRHRPSWDRRDASPARTADLCSGSRRRLGPAAGCGWGAGLRKSESLHRLATLPRRAERRKPRSAGSRRPVLGFDKPMLAFSRAPG